MEITLKDLVEREVICCASGLIHSLGACATIREDEDYLRLVYGVAGVDEGDPTAEPLEHWIVSRYLAERLAEQGEIVVFDYLGFPAIWGRTVSGQMIEMDSVIETIHQKIVGR
jgi:hypothetical protein